MTDIEKRILDIIDEKKDELISLGEHIKTHGEPGFREFNTAKLIESMYEKYGLPYENNISITGSKAHLTGEKDSNLQMAKKRVKLCLIGELDGISCPTHPFANSENGISHACGHNIQLIVMLGCMVALSHPDIKKELCGDIDFLAVPSEEYTDLEYKSKIKKEGKIQFGSGKSEMIRLGVFDDVDIALNHHLHMVETHADILLGNNTTNGFIIKNVTFKGKASHAAIAPHNGINALDAANVAMHAMGLQRPTYREKDYVRVHSMVSKGGDMVNVVPANVEMETQVRAKTMSAMLDASAKTDRCFHAGAIAMGAKVEIENIVGYLPVLEIPIANAMKEATNCFNNDIKFALVDPNEHNCASTDIGDLSHILPVLGFTSGWFEGSLHSAEMKILDIEKSYIIPIKFMAITIYNLLKDGAKGAFDVISHYTPHLTKEEYINYMNSYKKEEN